MDNYESQYEAYKQSLLRSPNFMTKFKEKYKNTLSCERDYIDKNGVLFKIGILSAACGAFIAASWYFDNRSDAIGIVCRAVFILVGVVCLFWAMHIGSEFKEASGKSSFYSFQYDRHIEDRVHTDKEREARSIADDLIAGRINKEEFYERFQSLSRYDRYARDLKDDYYFSKEIHKKLS